MIPTSLHYVERLTMVNLSVCTKYQHNLQPIARQRQWHQSFLTATTTHQLRSYNSNSNYHATKQIEKFNIRYWYFIISAKILDQLDYADE